MIDTELTAELNAEANDVGSPDLYTIYRRRKKPSDIIAVKRLHAAMNDGWHDGRAFGRLSDVRTSLAFWAGVQDPATQWVGEPDWIDPRDRRAARPSARKAIPPKRLSSNVMAPAASILAHPSASVSINSSAMQQRP